MCFLHFYFLNAGLQLEPSNEQRKAGLEEAKAAAAGGGARPMSSLFGNPQARSWVLALSGPALLCYGASVSQELIEQTRAPLLISLVPARPPPGPQVLSRLATDPQTRALLGQPDFMAMLNVGGGL